MPQDTYHHSDNADVYRENASFVYSSENTAPVLRLLDPQPGEFILDFGCGSGELTIEIARMLGPTGYILGQDLSSDMISNAELRYLETFNTESSPNLASANFVVKDAHLAAEHWKSRPFDKVFSNAALHWMKRSPSLVVAHVYGALRPGGRFAAELGGFMNCVGVRSHLHLALRKRGRDPEELDPWFFPTPAEYTALLKAAGFTVETCELVPRLTPLPKTTGLKGWLKTFAGPFLTPLPPRVREEVVAEVEEALRPDAYDAESGTWSVMYVRLRVLAHKPV